MQTIPQVTSQSSKSSILVGRILSSLVVAFFTLDGVMKLAKPAPVVEATVKLGFPESSIALMGVLLLAGTALYAFRRTTIVGAIILTGYLGGAVATNIRADISLFNDLFPALFGVLLWFAIWIRDASLRAMIPLRTQP